MLCGVVWCDVCRERHHDSVKMTRNQQTVLNAFVITQSSTAGRCFCKPQNYSETVTIWPVFYSIMTILISTRSRLEINIHTCIDCSRIRWKFSIIIALVFIFLRFNHKKISKIHSQSTGIVQNLSSIVHAIKVLNRTVQLQIHLSSESILLPNRYILTHFLDSLHYAECFTIWTEKTFVST